MASYPEGLLRGGERVLEHLRPHWRMLVVPALLPPLLAAPTGFVAAMVSAQPWRAVVWGVLAVLAGGLFAWFGLLPAARWRCTHLVVTDRRLLVREGVVRRGGIELAAASITAVRLRQTVLERLLGCGTLVVDTAGDDEPWEFDGIPRVGAVAATLEEVAEERGGLEPREPAPAADLDSDLDSEPDSEPDPAPDPRPAPRREPSVPALRSRRVARTSR